MIRKCYRCSQDATNLETAPIGCCDNCWDGIQEAILKIAQRPGGFEPRIVSCKEYRDLEFIAKRKK